jgi:hypothetical protein
MSQKVTGYSYTLSTAGITKYELRSTTRYTYIHVVCTYNKIINEINLLDLSLRLLHCAHLHFYNNRVLRTTRRHYVLYNMYVCTPLLREVLQPHTNLLTQLCNVCFHLLVRTSAVHINQTMFVVQFNGQHCCFHVLMVFF